MEGRLVDRVARALAERRSRRSALRAAGAGGAAMLVASSSAPRAAAQSDDALPVCVLDLEVSVRFGPSAADARDAVIAGELRIPFGPGGSFEGGTLTTDAGDEYEVVGQASGRAVDLRIRLGGRDVIVGVGAGDASLRSCRGEYGGPAVGPVRGDLGDWRAIALELIDGATPTAAPAGGNEPTPEPTTEPEPTPCEPELCDEPLKWDDAACACTCSWIDPNMVTCGSVCCPAFSVCDDPGSSSCACPAGTVLCGNTCVPECTGASMLNDSTCICE